MANKLPYTEQIRRYKANIMVLESKVIRNQSEIRLLQLKIKKLEARESQVIELLKIILKKANPSKGKNKTYTEKITIQEIINFMDKTIREYNNNEPDNVDFMEIISSGENTSTEFGLNPDEVNK